MIALLNLLDMPGPDTKYIVPPYMLLKLVHVWSADGWMHGVQKYAEQSCKVNVPGIELAPASDVPKERMYVCSGSSASSQGDLHFEILEGAVRNIRVCVSVTDP